MAHVNSVSSGKTRYAHKYRIRMVRQPMDKKDFLDNTLCWFCRQPQQYYTQEKMKETTVNGINIRYKITEAFCSHCGNRITVPGIEDTNLIELENAIREKKAASQ